MKEVYIALLAVSSWTAATFFSDGVEQLVDNYFLTKYHNKALLYFVFSAIFIILVVYFSRMAQIHN
jgi:hypothetical protein